MYGSLHHSYGVNVLESMSNTFIAAIFHKIIFTLGLQHAVIVVRAVAQLAWYCEQRIYMNAHEKEVARSLSYKDLGNFRIYDYFSPEISVEFC